MQRFFVFFWSLPSPSPLLALSHIWKKMHGQGIRRFFSSEVSLTLLSGLDKGTALLHLSRPASKNALGRQMLSQFNKALEEVRGDAGAIIRALVIVSEVPGVFCSGADLKERALMSKTEATAFVQSLRSSFTSLATLPVPTVAAVEGVALGGGLELALACDFRIAASSATLGLPETSLAIIPGAGGTQRLPRLIGPARAKELIFSGRRINGDEAFNMGLVCRSVPTGQALENAVVLARSMLGGGPVAVRAAKEAVNSGLEVDLASGLTIEASCYAQVIPTADRMEGLTAFREKRLPVYKGE